MNGHPVVDVDNVESLRPKGLPPQLGVAQSTGLLLECVSQKSALLTYTEIGEKAWLFAKLQPGRARKKINAT